MKVRVADVYNAGENWQFISGDTEDISAEQDSELKFRPVIDLLSVATNRDPSLKGAKLELIGKHVPAQRIEQQPQLAISPTADAENEAPSNRVSNHSVEPLEKAAEDAFYAASPLEHRPQHETELPLPQLAAPLPSPPLASPPVAAGGAALPPGFDIEIQAAAPRSAPFGLPSSPGDNGFDYFTATQLTPTEVSPSKEWAKGLALPAVNGAAQPPAWTAVAPAPPAAAVALPQQQAGPAGRKRSREPSPNRGDYGRELHRNIAPAPAVGAPATTHDFTAATPRPQPLLPGPVDPNPPETGFVGFRTGHNAVVTVDPEKLKKAQQLLAMDEDEDTADTPAAAPAAELPPQPATRGFVGFTTGSKKPVVVSEQMLAKAKALLADDDDDSDDGTTILAARQPTTNGFGTPGGAAASHAGDTPALQKQLLRSRLAANNTPLGNNGNGAARPINAGASNMPANPSRFGPTRPTPGAASSTRPAPLTSAVPSGAAAAAGVNRKGGRGKFTTPRPIGVAAGTPASGAAGSIPAMKTINRAAIYAQSSVMKTAKPLHSLASSALKAAREQVIGVMDNAAARGTAAPPGWPSCLPLSSLAAANFTTVDAATGSCMSWEAMRLHLLDAGANSQYASNAWVQNHYRWVVWKLARCELDLGPAAAGKLLTAAIVEDELRKRYEREFNQGHRPLLKTVLQHDESAAGTCALMVASIRNSTSGGSTGSTKSNYTNSTSTMLELTDGWYWIMAECDSLLSQLVARGRIMIGSKLRIKGAELVSSGPGEALEAARSAMLKLHANGVHRMPSKSILGRQRDTRMTFLPLSSVQPHGGAVPQTLVVVLRKYPRLMFTKLPSGVSTFQTSRAQAAAAQRLEAELSNAESSARAQVQAAEVKRCKEWLERGKPGGMTQLDRWYATIMTGDGDEFMRSLNNSDRALLGQYIAVRRVELEEEARRISREALAADVPKALESNSKEVAMLLVGEVTHESTGKGRELMGGFRQPARALITVWQPAEDLAGVKEGEVFAVSGLEPNPMSMNLGSSVEANNGFRPLLPESVLHLESRNGCLWQKQGSSLAELPKSLAGHAMPRAAPNLAGMAAMAAAAAAGERHAVFDFTGVVLKVGRMFQNMNPSYPWYQWLFLADSSLGIDQEQAVGQGRLLAVRLQGHLDAISWFDHGDEGTVVRIQDLEYAEMDDKGRMWRCHGGKHSAIVNFGRPGGSSGRTKGAAADAAAEQVSNWCRDNPEVVKGLVARVEALLAS